LGLTFSRLADNVYGHGVKLSSSSDDWRGQPTDDLSEDDVQTDDVVDGC